MNTYYFVDFENVNDDGMKNAASLSKDDTVHIFYTENASKCSMDIFQAKGASINFHKVAKGGQSLDKHLLSYLGYLIGLNQGKPCNYVIIAKDKGYDEIIKFWTNEIDVAIERKPSIPKAKASSATNQKQQTKKKAAKKEEDEKQKRENQIRSIYGNKFKKKVYVTNKDKTLQILINAKSKQDVNNKLLKLYHDNEPVTAILKEFKPLIKELPGK